MQLPFSRPTIRLSRGAAALVAGSLVAVAGPGLAAASANAPVAHAASATLIGSASKGKLGRILVNNSGQTLYMFTRDPRGRSDCSGSCAGTWIPVLTGSVKAKPGSGVNSRLLGLTTRSNGYKQATYDHHPLYRYKGDRTSKTTAGEGANQFGGFWYALNTKGGEVKPKSSGSCNPVCSGY